MLQIGWPQATMLLLLLLPMIAAVAKDGEEKPESLRKFNGLAALLRFAMLVGILYWGDFFA